jgi:hypothetical protein
VNPYDALLSLAHRFARLAADGDWRELMLVADGWERLTAALPATPPLEARPVLEEAAVLMAAATQTIADALASTGEELARLAQGRTALGGYAPSGTAARTLDARA